ncbi:hypothetical protein FSP39_002408 [Pinctada imbricata]|uniref:Uncharacterized protein n=1 Tax=Pinctada imbricata TaxID=66713 RepID=A0AA88YPH9_PINIB|nr:hypothetical protein FSP39_002408 [Pinctada imbricata]
MGRKIVLMDAGHVRIFKWTSIAQNKILSNAPVLVAQSFRVEANFRLQESIAIVPAETHYLTKYSFPQNVGNKFSLYVAISVSVKFTIKVKGTYNGTAEAKGQVLFKHKDSNGHNVDLDTELPISIPFLVYAYRRDRETTGKHDFDIMTNPVGFNFSSEVLVPRQIRDRHRCTSIGLPTTTLTTQRSKSTSQNDRASTVATTLQTTSSGFIDEMTTSGCSYESPKPPLHPPDFRTKNISQSLERKLQSIRKVLTIDKSNLSSTKRRKISASDDRKSARGIGFVGLTILCIVMGLIVLMDLPLLLSHVTILCRGTFGLAVEFARRRSNCSRRKQGLK